MDADFVQLMHTKGEPVVDREGSPIGKVAQLACEPLTYRAEWLVVKTSMVGRQRLVPVDGAVEEGGAIRVPYSKTAVFAAPLPLVTVSPDASECAALEEHYRHAA